MNNLQLASLLFRLPSCAVTIHGTWSDVMQVKYFPDQSYVALIGIVDPPSTITVSVPLELPGQILTP